MSVGVDAVKLGAEELTGWTAEPLVLAPDAVVSGEPVAPATVASDPPRRPRLVVQATDGGEAIEAMPVVQLEQRCYEEALRYYRCEANDGRYGYQLFRRAIVDRDQQAWAAIECVYRGQLVRWARCHRLYIQAGEEAEELANRALENLWRRVGPSSFEAFPNLSSILGYLQRCVANLVIDQARMRAREQQRAQALGQAMAGRIVPTPQLRALDRVRADEIWGTVRGLCRNDREEVVAYCYLVLGFKPSDILAWYPVQFGSTTVINAILATLLKRLRRNPTLRQQCLETLAS